MPKNSVVDTYRRYNMHKYWGKKPASGLMPLIQKYSKPGDTLLDPFSGYGVFCSEGYLSNRSVIVNDLNPIANFISSVLLDESVNLDTVRKQWSVIKKEFQPFIDEWYQIKIGDQTYMPISVLRNKNGLPLAFTYQEGRKTNTMEIPQEVAKKFLQEERERVITDWYPDFRLISNSRISAHEGMVLSDLFTRRTLACHARLFSLIKAHSTESETNLLLLAFTANLANCSKLVPPINTRGALAQGAWMTGFYIGETYIENNVLHYFENRLMKALSGKAEYYACLQRRGKSKTKVAYFITKQDAKHLQLEDKSVDYIFTDPPYGDSVPYFEQSVIWNAWLGFLPDYENEIIISNSTERVKDIDDFSRGINDSVSEINRVLKDNHFFSITYHSLSGLEWKAVTNACLRNNFVLYEYEWLEQKTLPPRQIARMKTIKGDVLVTFKKSPTPVPCQEISDDAFRDLIGNHINNCINHNHQDTNSIMMSLMKWILEERILVGNVDVFAFLNNNYQLNKEGQWQNR